MDDDLNLNPNLEGEITETPSASPAGTTTSDIGSSVNQDGAGNLSPEEVSWNTLSGSAQDRFRDITREANRLRREKADLESRVYQTAQPSYQTNQPGTEEAVRKLSEIGMATKEDINQVVNKSLSGLVYNMELDRLEGRYDGGNGLPKFDREEYEDYVSRHPQYQNYTPEDVYQKMYQDEIFDWRTQHTQGGGRTTRQTASSSLRPTKTQVREEPLTPSMIEQRLNEADGPEWYDKNKDRINSVMARTAE